MLRLSLALAVLFACLGAFPAAGRQATPAPPAGGSPPVAIWIERAQVRHPVVELGLVGGVRPNVPSPLVAAWYPETAALGTPSNIVIVGASFPASPPYDGRRPGVFAFLADLAPGDRIELLGADGQFYAYAVDWIRVDVSPLDAPAFWAPTAEPSLTLQTGGEAGGTVVRATAVAPGDGATPAV